MSATELERVRCGGRNFLRVGDPISVAGIRAGKRRYPGKVRRIVETAAGVEVEYVVTRPPPAGRFDPVRSARAGPETSTGPEGRLVT